ncbi:MAG: glycoside hydrolase family 3 C-terminal domain-containing protein [Lachnospiraceae bacterium]|nr:glycoside hydrolase family 3 C-terminal domain-containing protein [Lachnospiraceae bacterium]
MEDFKKTPLWDSRLSIKERIDYLLSEMTIEEKLTFLGTGTPELPRLGITRQFIGSEAAHGVEARHDQGHKRDPEPTTSFPQPIGMSASWDPELLKRAGHVVGKEARVLYQRTPVGGLFRWAPTVDMERDPRWGRNEEGYGEDPFLTGKMASGYVQGMQGDDPDHLLISSALKHFFANNVENGRAWKSSGLDARNRNEYYYEPFRRVIQEGGATSLMTAYNAVNEVTGMLDHRCDQLIRGKWGFDGHIVSDGGAVSLVHNVRKETASHAETVARSLKAGVDCMTDDQEMVAAAAKEAYENGWITEEDVDRALRHSFSTKLRLGFYDAYDTNPWNHVGEEELDSPQCREVSLKLAEESLVLMKNDGLLPLSKDARVSLIGPLSDQWFQDWYGGEPIYRKDVRFGMEEVLGRAVEMERGLDEVLICCEDGYAALDENHVLILVKEKELAERFCVQDWGDNSITFYVPRIRKYLSFHEDGLLAADMEIPFGWFVKECFNWSDGYLNTWYHARFCVRNDGFFCTEKTVEELKIGVPQTEDLPENERGAKLEKKPVKITLEVVSDGISRAVELAKKSDVVVLNLGSCPMINGKEDAERPSIVFPPAQRALAQAVLAANPNTVLVLLTNYPYALDWEAEHIPAILMSATGSQDMGTAIAGALFGDCAPAGRLNMTWYPGNLEAPDMDDYDIVKTKRTYRFFDQKPLFSFGHGLTYSTFVYENLNVCSKEDSLTVTLTVTNQGKITSDDVVQIYVKAPAGRTQKPNRQLVGFERLHDVKPGESRAVTITVPRKELCCYDVVRGDFMIEEGIYVVEAGASSTDIRLTQEIFVAGEKTQLRAKGKIVSVDHWDDYNNVILGKGPNVEEDCESCCAYKGTKEEAAWICYRDWETLEEGDDLEMVLEAAEEGEVHVLVNGQEVASWKGATDGFTNVTVICGCIPACESGNTDVTFELVGDVKIAAFQFC